MSNSLLFTFTYYIAVTDPASPSEISVGESTLTTVDLSWNQTGIVGNFTAMNNTGTSVTLSCNATVNCPTPCLVQCQAVDLVAGESYSLFVIAWSGELSNSSLLLPGVDTRTVSSSFLLVLRFTSATAEGYSVF